VRHVPTRISDRGGRARGPEATLLDAPRVYLGLRAAIRTALSSFRPTIANLPEAFSCALRRRRPLFWLKVAVRTPSPDPYDLRRIFFRIKRCSGSTTIVRRAVAIVYITALARSHAVGHDALCSSPFGRHFGEGLWGLLEIASYVWLSVVVLRAFCDALLGLFKFKANEDATASHADPRISSTLLEDLREAAIRLQRRRGAYD